MKLRNKLIVQYMWKRTGYESKIRSSEYFVDPISWIYNTTNVMLYALNPLYIVQVLGIHLKGQKKSARSFEKFFLQL